MGNKVLVLDIDGTLTNSKKEITDATKRSIQDILQRGHQVILASGRPTYGMKGCEKALELSTYGGYLLSFNGAKVIDCRSQEVVYQQILPQNMVAEMYGFAKANGCGLMTYQGDRIITAFSPDEYILLDTRVNGMKAELAEDFVEYVNFDVNKCLLTVDPDKADAYVKQLSGQYGDVISVYRSEPFYIEIMPLNVDKAATLDKLLPMIGGRREDTICCGDGFNDISMIRYAGLGVAMGNAQQRVKDAADYITDTNDNDGLIRVIEEFILKGELHEN